MRQKNIQWAKCSLLTLCTLLLACVTTVAASDFDSAADDHLFYDLHSATLPADVSYSNMTITPTDAGLVMSISPNMEATLTISGELDLSKWIYLTMDLENRSDHRVRLNPSLMGHSNMPKRAEPLVSNCWLYANEKRSFNCILLPEYATRRSLYGEIDRYFTNMRGIPYGISWARSYDISRTTTIKIEFLASDKPREVILHAIKGRRAAMGEDFHKEMETFFPFIDRFGQYSHDDWRGKIHDEKDLMTAKKEEKAYLAQHTGSKETNIYGGYKDGARYRATGHFRVEKIDGRWWFIDPDGYLYWSNGVNSAGKLQVLTPVKDREHYFEEIPARKGEANSKYYAWSGEYDFGAMIRDMKYGGAEEYLDISLQRMKSWGFNSMGGWSNTDIVDYPAKRKIPYPISIGSTNKVPTITGKFPDVYDPAWELAFENTVKRVEAKNGNDPFFIGYFVDNELYWYSPDDMMSHITKLPAKSAAKSRYVELLEERLGGVEIFNQKVGSNFTSWQELMNNTKKLKVEGVADLNEEFYRQIVEIYFSTISEVIKRHSPNKLYLGCRWHVSDNHRNEINVAIGAKYLDVISFNQYDNELTAATFPEIDNIDKPYLISEFNFGALDTGKFYPGLGFASDQRNRGEKFCNYVESALRDPKCVGTHWFMWANSTTAGRSVVGENANCGLVSEVDAPAYEMLDQIIPFSYNLYKSRLQLQ